MSEPRVTKRKTHTKSRKGCYQCKQRHTKCNEGRPRCGNCVRLDISCTWPEITSGYSTSPHASPSSHTSPHEMVQPGTSDVAYSTNIFELSIPDMRLLHHWTTKGYIALYPHLAERSDSWANAMIELAFEHLFLLHGILALSAVHKASFLLPINRQDLLLQADVHVSQALETMRKHLETPNYENTVPMFVLSSVLLTYNFGSVQEMPEDPIGSVHHCFMLLNGIKVVVGPHWERMRMAPVLFHMVEMSSPVNIAALEALAKDDRRPEILCLIELTELVLDAQDKTACADAIQELHSVSTCVLHIAPDRDEFPILFLWAVRVSPRFFDLLAAQNPVACIITVHFAGLLAQVRPVWWVVKWPRWLLTAAKQLLAATPDLLEWLDWPQSVINSAPISVTATPGSC
ncbi:hypothetical protein GQ44DRAFT_615449 [Phaeosphaeriaceae sp. PMI808]|nr:hypothetical protein GQ44DRAFT_615449 [Phaeosphaeriaceae sp. PMI808]